MAAKQEAYSIALDYLYRQLPMFQRIGPAAFKKDLTNIRALCAALGQPERAFPSIHVAGTNGKGSVSHFIAAVLQARGLRTGLYTSPHYRDFRERVKIDGRLMDRAYVVAFVEAHRALFESVQPSFFEISVAMAFDYFARRKVDVAVVEVGLGGRLDSTNVLLPELGVITNISFDHMEFLGDTLPLIAGEKAGIIKPGVPVVIGETHPETKPVFDAKAQREGAPITYADQHFRAEAAGEDLYHATYHVFRDGEVYLPNLKLNAAGPYQRLNLQTTLQALTEIAPRFDLQEAHLRAGLADVRARTGFLGRWQVIGEAPTVLCDSAHNEGGLALTMARLAAMDFRQLHVVIGFVNDKALDKLLALLPGTARYYFAKADVPRGLDARQLREQAAEFGLRGRAYVSVRNALRAARRAADPEDLIFVGGSIFVVAETI